jgi:hypothetical protein
MAWRCKRCGLKAGALTNGVCGHCQDAERSWWDRFWFRWRMRKLRKALGL